MKTDIWVMMVNSRIWNLHFSRNRRRSLSSSPLKPTSTLLMPRAISGVMPASTSIIMSDYKVSSYNVVFTVDKNSETISIRVSFLSIREGILGSSSKKQSKRYLIEVKRPRCETVDVLKQYHRHFWDRTEILNALRKCVSRAHPCLCLCCGDPGRSLAWVPWTSERWLTIAYHIRLHAINWKKYLQNLKWDIVNQSPISDT